MSTSRKVAVVTPTCNDYPNLPSFKRNVAIFRESVAHHIIVDNGSEADYREALRNEFPGSTLIFREQNGGTTAAFNDGIRHALSVCADAILLLAQDVRISSSSIETMTDLLFSRDQIGVVGGVLLAGGTDSVIQEFGGTIDKRTFDVTRILAGERLNADIPETLDVDFVSGGLSMAKADVYRSVGLQDDRIFMYFDEVDWDLRVKSSNYRIVVIKGAVGTHEHIARRASGRLRIIASYFYTRNRLLLIRKNRGFVPFILRLVKRFVEFPATFVGLRRRYNLLFYLLGLTSTLMGFDSVLDRIVKRYVARYRELT